MEQEFKDYYAALGVSSDADDKTIKQTYRKLARQYHPDVNPGDTAAEDTFKELNEAYQVLGDPEKRKQYDTLREQYRQWQQRGGMGGFNYQQPGGAPGGFAYSQTISPEDLQDLFGGESPFSDFFSSMFGQGAAQGAANRPMRGRDIEATATISLEEAFHGTTRGIQVGERHIEARIPAGARSGTRIRLAGQGSPGAAGRPAGDLYLQVEIAPHPVFEREQDDLTADIPVDIYTAAVGGEARVQTMDGTVRLKIPPRTQADRTFRLRGKGMPRLNNPEQRGDMYVKVKLVLPDELSEHEEATLRNLAQERQAA
jgi:curved DNA-binding protein